MRFVPLQHVHELEERIAALIRTGNPCVRRDALALCLGLHGFRVSEVARCTVDRLDVHAGTISPPVIKRGKARVIPLDPSVLEALRTWRENSACRWLLFTSRGKRVFPSHWERFARKITAEVFGVPYRFHSLRHTFAMRVYAKTKDLLLVKRLLGHRSINSTLVYAEALDELPRELLFRLPPSGIQDSSLNTSSLLEATAATVDKSDGMQRNALHLNVFHPAAAG